MEKIFLYTLVLFLVFSCADKQAYEEAKDLLLETDRKFSALSEKKGTALAFKEFLSDDALQFNTGNPIIEGKDGIYDFMNNSLDSSFVIIWEPLDADVSKSLDLGYTWGRYTILNNTLNNDTSKVLGYGKYVNIWKKQKNGSWKVKIDIGNSSPSSISEDL